MMGAIVTDDANFVGREVFEGFGREGEVPISFFVATGGMSVWVPLVEVANEGELVGLRGIFAIGPLMIFFIEEEAVGAVKDGLVFEGSDTEVLGKAVTTADDRFSVRCEP